MYNNHNNVYYKGESIFMDMFKQKIKELFSLEYDKASNKEIREAIISGANIKGTNMFILMIAIFIASIGLNMNSTAVIIGAMLISPLMGGIMAIGFGMATNDLKLVRKAFVGLLLQILICLFTSTLYFALTPISAAQSELLARTNPTIWDVLIAFFGGLAGTIGVTRKEKTNVIPGVAIATALMPPLCTVGYGIAIGSIKFTLGAFYLFFINSFFICVSSYIITKLMHIPKQSYIDEKAEKKVQRYVYLIGMITIIPSVILAYQIVSATVFDNNIQRYLHNELNFDETQVVRSYVTEDKKNLVIALLGKRIEPVVIDTLEKKLEQYNLNNVTLKITQTENENSLSSEDIQALIEQQLDTANTQIALSDKESQIELLKSELVHYKTQLIEYESTQYDTASLGKELSALFPQIKDFSLEQTDTYNVSTQKCEVKLVAILSVSSPLTPEQEDCIKSWLNVKTSIDNIELYFNIPIMNEVSLTDDVSSPDVSPLSKKQGDMPQ